jgi:cell division septation protein DedD
MGKYDRGVYEPSDEVRAFDGAEDEDDVEGSRLPLLIVLALLVLAMFAGVVWLAYTQGVARGRGDTPVLTAAAGPERVAPPAAASGTVPYQGFKIYEQPAPPDDEVGDVPVKPAPVAAAPAAPKPAPVAVPAPAPPKAAAMAPSPPAAKPAPVPASAAPKSVASLIQQSNSVPAAKSAPAPAKPVAAPPKPASAPPAARQAASAPPSVATGAPRQLGMAAAPPPAAPKIAAAPLQPAPAKPAGGGFVLQIGSYKSQADAEAAWRTYKGHHAALLSGYSENIQQADLGDRGTWYRLRIGGLADREVAGALCDRLKADGGACILGR